MTIRELREKLTSEDVKNILRKYGVEPYYENNNYIIYPTVCHNPIGSECSNKLYYYKNTSLFRCYTSCGSIFDIFDLIIKIENMLGRKVGKSFAINFCGLQLTSKEMEDIASDSIINDIAYLTELNYTAPVDINNLELKPIDAKFMDSRFIFDIPGMQSWIDEGIDINTLLHYNISYDPINNCIIIPHYDAVGNVVGIRGRYLSEDAVAKYKPITYNGQLLNHPTSETLYGFYQNKKAISASKSCIIFEAEKSVMKLDSLYYKNNISVAVCGQNISSTHIQLLLSAGVSNVIIAFDADYTDYNSAKAKLQDYKKIAKPLLAYFNVSIIIDFHNRLGYKDSPIDCGEQLFKELMKERVYL